MDKPKVFLLKMMVGRGPTGIYRIDGSELPGYRVNGFHKTHPVEDVEVAGTSLDHIRGKSMYGPAVDRVRKHLYWIEIGRPQRLIRVCGYEPDSPRQVLFESEMITDPTNNNRDGKRGMRNHGQYSGVSTNELTTGWFQMVMCFDERRQRLWWVGGGMKPLLYSADVGDVPVATTTDIDEDWRAPPLVTVVQRAGIGGQLHQMCCASDGSVFLAAGGSIVRYNPREDASGWEDYMLHEHMPDELTKGRKPPFGAIDIVPAEMHPDGQETMYLSYGRQLLSMPLDPMDDGEVATEKTVIFAPDDLGITRLAPRMKGFKTIGPAKDTQMLGPVVDQSRRTAYWINPYVGGKSVLYSHDAVTGNTRAIYSVEGKDVEKMGRISMINKQPMAYCETTRTLYFAGKADAGPRAAAIYSLTLGEDDCITSPITHVAALPGDLQHGQMACDPSGRLYLTTINRGPGVFRCDTSAGGGFTPFIKAVATKEEEYYRGCAVAGPHLYFTCGVGVKRCPLDNPDEVETVGRPQKDDQAVYTLAVDHVHGIAYSYMSAYAQNSVEFKGGHYFKKMSFDTALKSVYVRLHGPPQGRHGMAVLLPDSAVSGGGAEEAAAEPEWFPRQDPGPLPVGWLFVQRIMIDRTVTGGDGIYKLDLGSPGRAHKALQQAKKPYQFRAGHSFGGGMEAMALDRVHHRCLWVERTDPAQIMSCTYGGHRKLLFTAQLGDLVSGSTLAYDESNMRVYWFSSCRTPVTKLMGLRVAPGEETGLPVQYGPSPKLRVKAAQMCVSSNGYLVAAYANQGVYTCLPSESDASAVEWKLIAGTDAKSNPTKKAVHACEVVKDDPQFPGVHVLYFAAGANVYKMPLTEEMEKAGDPILVGVDLNADGRKKSLQWMALAVDHVNRTVYLRTGGGSRQNSVRWHAMEADNQIPDKEAYYNFPNSMRCHSLCVHPGGITFDADKIEKEASDAERRGTGKGDSILSAGSKKKSYTFKVHEHPGSNRDQTWRCMSVDAMAGRAYLCHFGKSSQSGIKFVDLNDPKSIDANKAYYNFPSCQTPHCLTVHPAS